MEVWSFFFSWMKWKGYFERVDLMLKVVDFSFELIILFLKIADEKSSLLWDKNWGTSHGIELLIELIEVGSLLFVESLVVSHGKRITKALIAFF